MYTLIEATRQAQQQAAEALRLVYVVEMVSDHTDMIDRSSLIPTLAEGDYSATPGYSDFYDPITYNTVTGFQAALWRCDNLAMELLRVAHPDGALLAVSDQAAEWAIIEARYGAVAAGFVAEREALLRGAEYEAVLPQLEAAYARASQMDAKSGGSS